MNRKERRRQEKQANRQGARNGGITAALEAAASHFQAGELDQAAAILEDARRSDPGNYDATLGLAVIHATRGNLNEAVLLFERAAALRPDEAEAHYNLGKALTGQGRLDEAAAAYRRSLAIDPKQEAGLLNLGNVLKDKGEIEAAAECYRRAIAVNPRLALAHHNLGNILKELGNLEAAIGCYEAALKLDPRLEAADIQLHHARGQMIQGWHFGMLADEARNDAYRRAIEKAVKPGAHVLDIGTGSGLLAMMAARAGAARVTACERSRPLARAARRVIAENGFADRITVIEKSSEHLSIGRDMERPADVVVSEIVDVGLLREGVLPTLRHAARYLAAPGAVTIPRSAEIKAVLVEMPSLHTVNPLRSIAGFDLSAFDIFRDRHYQPIVLNNHDHRRLSGVFPAVAFDFARLPPSAPGHRSQSRIDMAATDDGTVHGIVFWFDLHLDDENTLTTSPESGRTHWGQAVQFFEREIAVNKGQSLAVTVTWSDHQISFAAGKR